MRIHQNDLVFYNSEFEIAELCIVKQGEYIDKDSGEIYLKIKGTNNTWEKAVRKKDLYYKKDEAINAYIKESKVKLDKYLTSIEDLQDLINFAINCDKNDRKALQAIKIKAKQICDITL